jgi:hypothetical protein
MQPKAWQARKSSAMERQGDSLRYRRLLLEKSSVLHGKKRSVRIGPSRSRCHSLIWLSTSTGPGWLLPRILYVLVCAHSISSGLTLATFSRIHAEHFFDAIVR